MCDYVMTIHPCWFSQLHKDHSEKLELTNDVPVLFELDNLYESQGIKFSMIHLPATCQMEIFAAKNDSDPNRESDFEAGWDPHGVSATVMDVPENSKIYAVLIA